MMGCWVRKMIEKKKIKFTIEYEFDIIKDNHKILIVIMTLNRDNEKVNRTNIKNRFKNFICVEGFCEESSFKELYPRILGYCSEKEYKQACLDYYLTYGIMLSQSIEEEEGIEAVGDDSSDENNKDE